jgi:hypothetical protein
MPSVTPLATPPPRPLALLTLMALALPAGIAPAQGPATAPLVLRLPGGTRALGLGDAFVAGRGAEVLFYNPAQIGVTRGTTLSLQRFASASTLGSLATNGPFGKIALGVGVQYLDYGATAGGFPTPPARLTQRGGLGSSSLAATVGGAFPWKGVRWGIAAKYVEERLPAARDGAPAFDLGAARQALGLTFGLAAQNLGGHLALGGTRAGLPARVILGAALPARRLGTYFDIGGSAAIARERNGRIVPAGGIEVAYVPVSGWIFAGRAGARRVERRGTPEESPFTFGATFGLDRFGLDYGFEPFRGPGATHRVGIRIQ